MELPDERIDLGDATNIKYPLLDSRSVISPAMTTVDRLPVDALTIL